MKKILSFLFAILLMAGIASADGIGAGSTGFPNEYRTVYNNSSGTLDAGDLVIWDIGSSTGDDDAYVTTTTTADTFLVAGVVVSDILDGQTGTILTKGIIDIDLGAAHSIGGANALLCSDGTTAGGVDVCSSTTSDADAIGYSVAAAGASTVKAYVFGR